MSAGMFSFTRTFVCLTALLALVACPSIPMGDDDIYATPDDDDVFSPLPGEDGWPCPEGPLACDLDYGCVDDRCGECEQPDDCRPLQGCRPDASCGECTADAECRDGESCREGFCMQTTLPTWDLAIAEADLEAMNDDVYARLEVPATLSAEGVTYPGPATARFMGSSTLTFPKKSFRVTFPEDAEHPGFARKINLRAEYNDASYLRTFLGYETMRRLTDSPAPRTRWVNLTVNGQPYGVMLEVERIGGRFLRKNGRDREQSTYEGKETMPWGALTPLPSEAEYREFYDKTTGDDADWSDFIGLVEGALWPDHEDSQPYGPTTTFRMRELVDVDAYIDYLATLATIQSQDHITNNYYLSWQNRPGLGFRWEFYPWDMDLTFGCLWDEDTNTSLCGEPVHDDWWLNGVVVTPLVPGQPNDCWCNLAAHLAINDLQLGLEYGEKICSNLRSRWWNERMPALAEAIAQTIGPAVEADELDRNQTSLQWTTARQEVLDFLVDRKAYLDAQLYCP